MTSPPFTPLEDRFVGELEKLEINEERATLAQLRRGLGKPLGFVAERDGWVLRRPLDLSQRELSGFAAIASLFALHSELGGSGSLGESFRRLAMLNPSSDGGPNPSVEKRFVALLNSNSEDLPNRLRHAVSLLKANNLAIGWRQLLHDVLRWDSSWRTVQINWSREFWGSRRFSATEGEAATEAEPQPAAASA